MARKLYYKIGEACKLLEIQPYVLRYWEKEFPLLKPSKSKSGQRAYSEGELDVIRRIKELLYEEGYTIAGAKKKLEAELEDPKGAAAASSAAAADTSADAAPASRPKPEKATAAASAENLALRSGVKAALVQAREILEILSSPPP